MVRPARVAGVTQAISAPPLWGEVLFYLYLLMLYIPGRAYVGDGVALSVALVPPVFLMYSGSALRFFSGLHPPAKNIFFALASIVVVYTFWAVVTAGSANDYLRVFRPIYGHVEGFGILAGIYAISRSPLAQRRLFLVVVCLFCVTLILSLTIGRVDAFGDRQPGFFKHPNQLGIIMSMFLVYFLSCAMAEKYRSFLYNIFTILSIFALFESGSKTNIVMIVPILGVLIIYRAKSIPNVRRAVAFAFSNVLLATLLVICSALVLLTVNPRAGGALSDILAGGETLSDYRTIQDRQEIWDESWVEFERSPLTGVGAGQPLPDGTEHSHNIFMDSLRTLGAPGAMLMVLFYLAILWYVFCSLRWMRQTWAYPKGRLRDDAAKGQYIGATLAMATYLITNQMSDSFGPSTLPFFYLFLGMSSAFLWTGSDHVRRPRPSHDVPGYLHRARRQAGSRG